MNIKRTGKVIAISLALLAGTWTVASLCDGDYSTVQNVHSTVQNIHYFDFSEMGQLIFLQIL